MNRKRVLTDLFGRRRHRVDPAVTEALRVVGLADMGTVLARGLSLGQQKLAGVARALVENCRILLLDEPAAGLDSRESSDFATRIRGVAERGPGVLLIDLGGDHGRIHPRLRRCTREDDPAEFHHVDPWT